MLTGTVMKAERLDVRKLVMFFLYQFSPAQTRYHTTEWESLAVVRSLEEVQWLVKRSEFPVKLYKDQQALLRTLRSEDATGWIARWHLRLSEYDLEIHHVPGKDLPHTSDSAGFASHQVWLTLSQSVKNRIRRTWNEYGVNCADSLVSKNLVMTKVHNKQWECLSPIRSSHNTFSTNFSNIYACESPFFRKLCRLRPFVSLVGLLPTVVLHFWYEFPLRGFG